MWCLFRPSAPYSIRLFVHFLIFEFKELFVYFGQQSFVRCEFCKYFLPGLSSHSLDSIFHWQKFLILKKSSLSIISFVDHAFDTVSKKSSPNPSRFSPLFPSRSFIVLHFTFRCISHFELIFVRGIKSASRFFFFFFFVCGSSVVPAPFVEETIFSPL